MYDETPNDKPLIHDAVPTTHISHAIYNSHIGMLSPERAVAHESVDLSQYRCDRANDEKIINANCCVY